MDNPIPSVMVYFDNRELKGVICVDGRPDRGLVIEPCTNSDKESGFHTPVWRPLGWMGDAAFMAVRPGGQGAVAEFVRASLFSVIAIRDDFDRMRHERDEVRKINTNLSGIIRNLTGVLNSAIPYIESEKVRLKMFKAISKAQSHVLTAEDGEGN